jgi:hypothetical protein
MDDQTSQEQTGAEHTEPTQASAPEAQPTLVEVLQVEIGRLELSPTDVLVMKLPDDMDMRTAEHIVNGVQAILGENVRILMLPKSVDVSVAAIEDSAVLGQIDEIRTETNKLKMDVGAANERINEVATAVGSDPQLGSRVASLEAKIRHFV